MTAAKSKSAILVLCAAALWGCIGLFTNALSARGLTALEITSVRLTGSAIVLSLLFLVRDRSLFRIRFCDLWCFLGTGIGSFVFFNWCYFNCIQACSLSVAAILLYTAPCFVILLSALFFREKLTAKKGVALLLTFGGCVLVTGLGSGISVTAAGLLLGLGSGVGYALYSIFGRAALQRGYSPAAITLWTVLCGGLGVLPLLDLRHYDAVLTGGSTLLLGLGLILLCTILPMFLYTTGLSGLENGRASLLATLEPVIATVLSVLVYHEQLGIMRLVGILLVLLAVWLLRD